MHYYQAIYIVFFLLFPSFFTYAKTYTEADLKSQVYITWHLGADCKSNAPRTLSFGVNKESILCLQSGAPYQPLYFKLQPEKQKSTLSCAYGLAGKYGDCSDNKTADHCTFKNASDKCIVKIKGTKTVDISAKDFLLKKSVLESAVFDQYAPLYTVDQAKYGNINLSNIHGMAISKDGKSDIVTETATLTGAISATPVTVTFSIDGQPKNTDQLVVLRFVDKTACTITPTKQPDGSYGGSCSIQLMPNRFGTATISATANNYDKIESASARVGAFYTISQSQFTIQEGKCYLNAKNIAVTSKNLKPERPHDIKIHDSYCENQREGLNVPYPIADEYYGSLLFSFGSSKTARSSDYQSRLLRIKLNANAMSDTSVVSDIKEIYTWKSGDDLLGNYLRIGEDTAYQTNFIALITPESLPYRHLSKAYEFSNIYQSSTLPAPTEMKGFTPGNIVGGDLKDGTKSRYTKYIIAIMTCDGYVSDDVCDGTKYNIQALERNAGGSWISLPLRGLPSLDQNSFAFLTRRLESPLFSYSNNLYLMVLESTLKIFRFDFQTFTWVMAIDTKVNKERLVDTNGKTPQPINRDFRVNLGFDNYIYFPYGPPSEQRVALCNLKTAKCNTIYLSKYWNTFEVKKRNKTVSAVIPDMHNNLWINITKPDETAPLIERRYFDTFSIKIKKTTDDYQIPDIIKVPKIHATVGDATKMGSSGVVSTAVYNNIAPPNEALHAQK